MLVQQCVWHCVYMFACLRLCKAKVFVSALVELGEGEYKELHVLDMAV